MPWEEGMPIPREELLAQQDGDYREIKKYMELAGITVSVLT
jgi:hypothetical protein